MGRRQFNVALTFEMMLDLDDAVLSAVDDEWRRQFYNLRSYAQIVEHIAGNLLRGASLSRLDGWADQPDANATLLSYEVVDSDCGERATY